MNTKSFVKKATGAVLVAIPTYSLIGRSDDMTAPTLLQSKFHGLS